MANVFFGASLSGVNFRFTETDFFVLGSNGCGTFPLISVEAAAQLVLRAAGTISLWGINVTTNSSGTSVSVGLRNQSGNLNSVCTPGTGTGQFQDATHTDSMASGDKLDGAVTGGASFANFTIQPAGLEWSPSSGTNSVLTSVSGASSGWAASTAYFQPNSGEFSATSATVEANAQHKCRSAATASNLALYITTNGNANALTFDFRNGGASQTQTLTVAAAATGYQEDVTHTDSIASGDLYDTRILLGASTISFKPEFTGLKLAYSGGQYDLFQSPSTLTAIVLSTSADGFFPLIGQCAAAETTEASTQTKYPFAETFQNLRSSVATTNSNFAIKFRDGGVTGAQTITLSSAFSEDVTHTDTCAANDLVNLTYTHGAGSCSIKGAEITGGANLVTIGLAAVASAGAVVASTPSVSVALAGVSAAGSAADAVVSSSGQMASVASTGAAAASAPSVSVALAGVSAAGAAAAVGVAFGGQVNLEPVAAAGAVGTFAATYDGSVALSGIMATGAAGAPASEASLALAGVMATGAAGATLADVPPSTNLPVFRLMRNTPVATMGAMGDTPVACVARLLASGPQPRSTAVDLAAVSAAGHAATVSPYRNVSVTLAGVAAGGRAGLVTGVA